MRAVGAKPAPLILDAEHKSGVYSILVTIEARSVSLLINFQEDAHFGGSGMFNRIVERLLEREKQIVANIGRNRPVRKLCGQVQTAANMGRSQEILREAAEVAGEAVQGVMLWIHCP